MKRLSVLIVIAIVIFLIEYWNNEGKYHVIQDKDNVIWPLAVGNKWVYQGCQSPEYHIEVIGTKQINKEEVFITRVSSEIELYYQNFMNKNTGLFSYGVIGRQNFIKYGMFESPLLGFKYPGFAGESYKGMKDEKMRIEGIDEKITTPAGNFRCYKYFNERENGDFAILWFSPNIGMVKEVGCVIIEGRHSYYRLLLKSYKLNRKLIKS